MARLRHEQYSEKLFDLKPDAKSGKDAPENTAEHDDLDAEIEKELSSLRKPETQPLFSSIRLDTQCRMAYSLPMHDHLA